MTRNLAWVVLALGSIWVSVAIISVTGSDVVFGADRTTFPLVPLVTWIWGAAASGYVLNAFVQRRGTAEEQRNAWIGIAVSTLLIWTVVTLVALILPDFTFNFLDDPIEVPLGSLITPAAGVVATAIACQYIPALTDVAQSATAERRY